MAYETKELGGALFKNDQKRLLWDLLDYVSRQVQWVVNGEKTFMDSTDWKDVFSAALRKYQRVAIGIEGGVVFLGMHTSRMTKQEFSDLIEIILSFGNEDRKSTR